jgi:predicted glycoside hydrolase/deacetylase ChbG (UPF0249 family)
VKYVIVNADDFGQSPGTNRGIIEAHEQGVVTSASLMVRRPAASEAAAYARARPDLAVGLHLELGEWEFRAGVWEATRAEVPPSEVPREVEAQADTFRELIGRDPTHVDSHQHVHVRSPARSAALALGAALGVPVRHLDPRVRYCGSFYGQTENGEPLPENITAAALSSFLAEVHDGVTELVCHPGYVEPGESPYAHERAREVASLCDPSVRESLDRLDIRLISFRDLEDPEIR